MVSHFMLLTILVPMAAALGSLFVGPRLRAMLFTVAAIVILAAATACATHVYVQRNVVDFVLGGWRPPLGIRLHLDGLSAVMVLGAAIIGTAISFYALRYFTGSDAERRLRLFWPLWYLLWSALNALFLSGDLFNLYVTLELINFSAVAMVALTRTVDALRASLRYLVIAFLGSLSYLFGVALLYVEYGALDLHILAAQAHAGSGALQLAAALILLGLIIKTAVFPMHFWLPPAHAIAPAPVSALLSGLVVTGSAYMIMRLSFTLFLPLFGTGIPLVLGLLGGGAVIWGSLHALLQSRVKMVIAYSTVAQLGYVLLLFPLAASGPAAARLAWFGGIYFLLCHACAKAAAFLAAGALMQVRGDDSIEGLRGAAQQAPMLVMGFAIAGINLIGLPPSGGFLGKWMLLRAAWEAGNGWVIAVMLIGSLLAAAYMIRIVDRSLAYEEVSRVAVCIERKWVVLFLACVPIALGLVSRVPLRLLEVGSPVGVLP